MNTGNGTSRFDAGPACKIAVKHAQDPQNHNELLQSAEYLAQSMFSLIPAPGSTTCCQGDCHRSHVHLAISADGWGVCILPATGKRSD